MFGPYGLLIYLTPDEARRLLTAISDLSAPGGQLSFQHSPMATATLTGQQPDIFAGRPRAEEGL